MGQRQLFSSIVLLVIAFATFFETSKLPIGVPGKPQTGFYPLILAILLTTLSLLLLWQAIKKKKRKEGGTAEAKLGGLKRVGLALGALFAFAFLFERLGYIITTFLLITFLLRAIEPQKWWVVILVAFLCSLISFLVFGMLLDMQLPQGILRI
jgi:putative tricarboxylic transport membrane protein